MLNILCGKANYIYDFYNKARRFLLTFRRNVSPPYSASTYKSFDVNNNFLLVITILPHPYILKPM